MDDLPVFLQMFVRLLAALTLGAWLHAMAPKSDEKEPRPRAPAGAPPTPAPTGDTAPASDSGPERSK